MAIIRVKHNNFEELMNVISSPPDTLDKNEWSDTNRLLENGWDDRYNYEADIISNIIKKENFKTILEIGSGPGILSQYIQKKVNYDLNYHLIDKPNAKKYFNQQNFKGTFFDIDISLDLNITLLLDNYDLIICNDCLEHLLAPSNIVKKINSLMHVNSKFFISIPNWRMSHQFIYRGLWDYDNVIYFFYIHNLIVDDVYPSVLQTPYYPKLDSEQTMPDELIQSWNFYFVGNKKT